ncbi:iron complex transport system ATP-binding protein [Desulfocicer vacuolatum DSM 3385]|uniref:Iron complex transport system ATP-binding protein n=1 Tax=Desulfocicer vacuolatum DSM 3385 TaxID=1121400 RepID=A0A1W2A0W5_9BACT|nr:ABC transporter ATP-binding protein [Desulfocicer vacuolatum]SMC54256.1 iron complex transport system ATP-binding protein [Desulfocicer vacuolatum DSM 3385]
MILTVNDISFKYNRHTTLKDISFTIKKGEITVVLGPNGVGKTTLLKCMNGILKPTCGDILVAGKNIKKMGLREISGNMSYVAQKCESARMTAFDAILMGRRPHMGWKVGKNDLKKVDGVIKHLGLEHLALNHVDEMSGGELQKVAIARALVQETDIILLDEPTSSLDMKNQEEILELIERVVKEHRVAAVMTMHDLNTALRYADNYIFLKEGSIFDTGPIEKVSPVMVSEVYGISVEIIRHKGYSVIIPATESRRKTTKKAA